MGNKQASKKQILSIESPLKSNTNSPLFICKSCGYDIKGDRNYCLYCDSDSSSFDLCEKCKKDHPHPLDRIEEDSQIEFDYFDNCSESLANRLTYFKEKRLFGELKRRSNLKEGESLCIEYLTKKELKKIGLDKESGFPLNEGEKDQQYEVIKKI